MKHSRRVVITGMGAITPLGHNPLDLYVNQTEGRSGAGPIFRFDARTFPTKFASQVKDFELAKYVPHAERFVECGLNAKFALAAARQALDDAGLRENTKVDRTSIGVYLGSGEGMHDFPNLTLSMALACPENGYKVDVTTFYRQSLKTFRPDHEYEMEMHTTSGHVAEEYDLQGPNYTCQTACAATSPLLGGLSLSNFSARMSSNRMTSGMSRSATNSASRSAPTFVAPRVGRIRIRRCPSSWE